MKNPIDLGRHDEGWRGARFLFLLLTLLVVLLIQAIFHGSVIADLAVALLYLNALLVAVSVAPLPRWGRDVLLIAWGASLVLELASPAALGLGSLVIFRLIGAGLLAFCIVGILHYVACNRQATTDPLFASLVAYFLMAMMFAQLYVAIDRSVPGSFQEFGAVQEFGLTDDARLRRELTTFNYFSFITISTVGFGDIVPKHPIAQTLVSIEAMIGQFYVTIVVAWLVSLYAMRVPTREVTRRDTPGD
ncbi:MAG: hypothetical protein RI963_2224 [Planctomycetota bacterium]|jgi:hypothetical protein